MKLVAVVYSECTRSLLGFYQVLSFLCCWTIGTKEISRVQISLTNFLRFLVSLIFDRSRNTLERLHIRPRHQVHHTYTRNIFIGYLKIYLLQRKRFTYCTALNACTDLMQVAGGSPQIDESLSLSDIKPVGFIKMHQVCENQT